jgi:hypothetical protein
LVRERESAGERNKAKKTKQEVATSFAMLSWNFLSLQLAFSIYILVQNFHR